MNRDDTVYLRHILECIRRIAEDIAEGHERFMASHTLQDAVLRNLQVMAESTQRLSETAKAKQPDIEWRKIAALRNILAHDYLGIDLDTVCGIRDVASCVSWRFASGSWPDACGAWKARSHRTQRIPTKPKALRHGGTILGTFAGLTLTSIRSQAMLHVANPKDCSSTAEDAGTNSFAVGAQRN